MQNRTQFVRELVWLNYSCIFAGVYQSILHRFGWLWFITLRDARGRKSPVRHCSRSIGRGSSTLSSVRVVLSKTGIEPWMTFKHFLGKDETSLRSALASLIGFCLFVWHLFMFFSFFKGALICGIIMVFQWFILILSSGTECKRPSLLSNMTFLLC